MGLFIPLISSSERGSSHPNLTNTVRVHCHVGLLIRTLAVTASKIQKIKHKYTKKHENRSCVRQVLHTKQGVVFI
jgi:hypothetical protein